MKLYGIVNIGPGKSQHKFAYFIKNRPNRCQKNHGGKNSVVGFLGRIVYGKKFLDKQIEWKIINS